MTTDEIAGLLQDFLPETPREDLNLFAEICSYQSFKDKELILESGNRLKKVFLVLEGVARGFIIDSDGDEKTIMLRGKGIFVAEAAAIFTSVPQNMSIVSVGTTKILLFSFASFEKLALSNPRIMAIYLNSLKEAILRLNYRIVAMVTMSSEERYLDLLSKNPVFLPDTYDKYIANYLGITPVSLSRIKKRLNLKTLNKG